MTDLQYLPIAALHPHPKNPRIAPRQDVVDMIAAQIAKGMDEAHALIVRPNADGYEILSGHQRHRAAGQAGLRELPCWVREMTDAEAYMALVQNNAQGELHPLEIGLHSLESGKSPSEYATDTGINRSTLFQWAHAAEVVKITRARTTAQLFRKTKGLAIIYTAPEGCWKELVERLLNEDMTVTELQDAVAEAKERTRREAAKKVRTAAQRKLERRKIITLEEWKEMDAEEQKTALMLTAKKAPGFNKQESADIEWAQFSWNPITGCLHDCPYCYARDIAKQKKMRGVYPYGFEPVIHPMRLMAPQVTAVPKEAAHDTRFRNVFTGSMADIFGRWVPAEWIEAVLMQVRAAPQWNFLFLTKFPKRILEFNIPRNAWMGTTVDLQARVANAEAAFSKLREGGYKGVAFLSVEPLLEPVKFRRLDLFDWLIIGGASTSSKTPEFRPPFAWIADLYAQAEVANCKIYMKTNLLGNRTLELPFNAPIKQDAQEAPDVFHYLGKTPNLQAAE